jgi:hypothetical protein
MKFLKPHQEEALAFLSDKKLGGLFMEMRLGKNLVIIRHIEQSFMTSKTGKFLFVSTVTAMNSFHSELLSEGWPTDRVFNLTGESSKNKKVMLTKFLRTSSEKKCWLLINYESVPILGLGLWPWTAVILDETIKIASPKSNITKYMLKMFANSQMHRFILNGKITPENPLQAFTQMRFISQNGFMGCDNFWQYRQKFYIESGFEWVPRQGHISQLKKEISKKAFVLLRKDASVKGVGSEKEYIKRMVPISDLQKQYMLDLKKSYEVNGVQYKNELGVQIALCYIASGFVPSQNDQEKAVLFQHNKLNELLNLISEIDGKILVFCRFKAEVNAVSSFLNEEGIRCISITGEDSIQSRIEIKEKFDTIPEIKIAVLSIASSAKGQDWSSADTIIYFSNEWSNDLRGQSEDRTIHVNKTSVQLIIDLVTANSIDTEVLEALKEKNFNAKLMMSKFFDKLK